jgi:N-acetylglucosamine-6-sulfatase
MKELSRRALLGSGITALLSGAQAVRRPNVLFLLTDDQSYGTLSCTGSPYLKTPNIDRIAREGAHFTNHFVVRSVCSPSRACYLTGLYAHTHGVDTNGKRLDQGIPTWPRTLHAAGYRTAHIGKWQMGDDDRVQPGYDYWAAQIGTGDYWNPTKNINGRMTGLKGYDTDIVTDQAIGFMRANKDKPFAVWLAYRACHGPFTPAPGHEKDLADVEIKPPPSFYIDDPGKPKRVREGANNDRRMPLAKWAEKQRNQYRSLMGVEDSVGRLLAFLDEQKLAEDTIVVYSSDNGYFQGEHGLTSKQEAYEEGMRVPFFVRYKRRIEPQRCDAMIANIDLAPTILEICEAPLTKPVQGRSWWPLVVGKQKSIRHRLLFETMGRGTKIMNPAVKALRTERYKLILNTNPHDITELYDLKNDPGEMKNLASEPAWLDLRKELERQLLDEMRITGDPALGFVEAQL